MLESEALLIERIKVGVDSGPNLFVLTVGLNAPRSLNALTLEMVDLLYQNLLEWQNDTEVVAVFLYGCGEKAFCAGGDIRSLYDSMIDRENRYDYCDQFFCREYRLDYLISQYQKPILCFGHGLVMGGGLGLMAGSQIRLVTEKSKLAMPEVTIGLFPDVGGTWFLNQMPAGQGLFLGLTGAQLNASDAKGVGLADYYVGSESVEDMINHLNRVQWSVDVDQNRAALENLFVEIDASHRPGMAAGKMPQYLEFWSTLDKAQSVYDAVKLISSYKVDDPWFEKARQNLLKGSPYSASLVYWQLNQGKALSQAEVFRQELIFARQCVRSGEFEEGIRALIVEKDNNPTWALESFEAVNEASMAAFFEPPWGESAHPLKDL